MAYIKARKSPNVMYAVSGAVSLGLALLVGNKVLTSVGTTIGNVTGTPFETALEFLGIDGTAENGSWSSTAIVGVMALVAVASFVMTFVKVSFKNAA